jgi:penicillin-binding protein 1C
LRNSDGAILSMVGSNDYTDHRHQGAFNGATARLRPGSTLKPFVYAAAMEQGDTPATMAFDLALPEDAHQFYTKDVKSHGFARYRESLAGSYNLSAVHTLQRVGIPAVLNKLRTAGLWTLDKADEEYDWGLAIGHAEVRLLDLTAAFSTFGRGGIPVKVRAIEKVSRIDGQSYREPARDGERVFRSEVAYQIFDILSDADARKPMFGDRVPMNLPFPVALKTGTTKAYTDLWALGTTAEYTVGVWGGNFDGSPTHQVMSLQGATPLMRAVYTAIAARYGDPTAPPRPETIVNADVCPLSGKLPGPHCSHHKTELFVSGNLPSETCDWHQVVCNETAIVYPKVLRGWVDFYGLRKEPSCDTTGDSVVAEGSVAEGSVTEGSVVADGIRIVAPVPGAHFLLEEHRPAQYQRPPLAALPARAKVQWFIDDEPAAEWVPTPGEHRVKVARGDSVDEITIVYE